MKKYYIARNDYSYSDTYIYSDVSKWEDSIDTISLDAKSDIEVGICETEEEDGWYRNDDRRPDEYREFEMEVLESQNVSKWSIHEGEDGKWLTEDESYDTEEEAYEAEKPSNFLYIG